MDKLIFIDNYDSFTYNLVQCFQKLGVNIHVTRGRPEAIPECREFDPKGIIIGPGPGSPAQAIIAKKIIKEYAGKIPILGVCLGHQCIAEVFGGNIVRAASPMHGKLSNISHDSKGVFFGMPQGFLATRYHSLIVDHATLPKCLETTAWTSDGTIMGLRHRNDPIEGVQFHPESICTESGYTLLKNFLKQINP